MSEAQWPVPSIAMYQRVLRIKQAMDQEEAPASTVRVQPEKREDEETLPYDPLPVVEVYNTLIRQGLQVPHGGEQEKNASTDILFSWDYLDRWADWRKWADWEDWDSWNK